MYDFINTTQKISNVDSASLPAEALNLNGEYIENSIPGYRTLYVSGRELLECEIDDYENGNVDGTQYRGKRHPPRIITVTYQLDVVSGASTDAEANAAFREAYNKLNELLDVPESKLIFADEPDKYFIGTKTGHSEVTPGTNRVIGEIDFYCTDPFKHSTVEKSFQASANSSGILETTIVNNGTEAVPVDYTIQHQLPEGDSTGNAENGFIGVVSEHGAIELGDIKELDGETKTKSVTLLNYRSYSDYMTNMGSGGIFYGDYGFDDGLEMEYLYEGTSWYGLNDSKTFNKPGWHGSARTVALPHVLGEDGTATNFALQGQAWFRPSDYTVNELGIMEYCIGDEDGKHLMSVRIAKWDPNRPEASILFCVGGKQMQEQVTYDPRYQNITTHDAGQFHMVKSGGKFEFCFGGYFRYNFPELAEKKAKTVSVFIGQREQYAIVDRMRMQYLTFRKDNVTEWRDIPNRYQPGDKVYIDGKAGKVYVNGIPSAGDIVKGSSFFQAPPGETKVQFYFSDFCTEKPEVTAKIREAYL